MARRRNNRVRRPYYVYGEGSVAHYEGPCPEGFGFRHPLIERIAWPSRWAYYRNLCARWAHVGTRGMRIVGKGEDRTMIDDPRPGDQLLRWLFGDEFPQLPTVYAPLRVKDSAYPDRWEHRDTAYPLHVLNEWKERDGKAP